LPPVLMQIVVFTNVFKMTPDFTFSCARWFVLSVLYLLSSSSITHIYKTHVYGVNPG